MTTTQISVQDFLAEIAPFNQLSSVQLDKIANEGQLMRYRMGQKVLAPGQMLTHISLLYQGQIRLIGVGEQVPVTLKLLQPGDLIGWISAIRGVSCEMAIASSESVCFNIPVDEFLELLSWDSYFANAFQNRPAIDEVFELLRTELNRRAIVVTDLTDRVQTAARQAVVQTLGDHDGSQLSLDPDYVWLLSSGKLGNSAIGDRIASLANQAVGSAGARLLGLPATAFTDLPITPTVVQPASDWQADIPYAPDSPAVSASSNQVKYPLSRGRGPVEGTLACFQMLNQFLGVPFRRDHLRRIIENQLRNNTPVSLQFCGGLAESMGLTAQLICVPISSFHRLQTPAMIQWLDGFAVLYHTSDREIVLGTPEQGIVRQTPKAFAETWGKEGDVLLLQSTPTTPKQRFSLRWFLPALKRHRRVLIEVLIASIVVQLIGLVNPLVTQVIIDKVLSQNSMDALTVLGLFLIVVSVVESVLTNVRTHLFTDTTNRIDLALSGQVIKHLLRLPLSYFERRPVGELATRVNELERIRQFLTGTALTVVLDAGFSIVYIAVMLFYSPMLTLVALATVPLFALLTLMVSPMIRRQARVKSEKNAATHSYLVETLSGIQTVKAQNLEMRARWQWQNHYSSYISAGFRTVSTQTTAGSISNFLNKLSSMLVLWAGAYLVLQGSLTLGQLIAFRIIAGYVTSPLLRLVQLWQNFQETALSLERLGDILDASPEQEEGESQLLMPTITGNVRYEGVSFAFRQAGPLQLCNLNLDFPAGTFVGIVGQSGSGKSTLTKLLPRLYEPQSGKVVIDGYDISKVELSSLRRQIGMVLQDTLLFDGTIRDNITLSNPDATDEQVIEAAKIAFAHDFIMALPHGYSTQVGERGSALSGGQRQRIAIARTVLQNPQLLILDEATSALDYNAEAQVCRNLTKTFRDRTVFFITHRLSTISHADIILMMDQGRVVEQGTHAELMALQGYYYHLYQQQASQV